MDHGDGRPGPGTDDGYRAAAALATGETRRMERLLRLAGILAAAAIVVALVAPAGLPPGPGASEGPASPSAVPTATFEPTEPLPTALPSLFVDPPAPSAAFPVIAGGLRWLDPTTGRMSGSSDDAPRGAIFVDPDGSATCVCREATFSTTDERVQIVLAHFAADGRALGRSVVTELRSPFPAGTGWEIQVGVARTPDRSAYAIAWIVRTELDWEVAFVTADAGTGRLLGRADLVRLPLGSLPGSTPPTSAGVGATAAPQPLDREAPPPLVRISPDGRQARIAIGTRPVSLGAVGPWSRLAWTVPLDIAGIPGAPARVTPPDGPETACYGEAYLSPSAYVALCQDAERPAGVVVRFDAPGGGHELITTLPGDFDEPATLAVLVDATRGALYAWSMPTATIARADAESRVVDILSLAAGGDPAKAAPPVAWPAPSGSRVRWVPLGPSFELAGLASSPALAGSPDGSLLYALGIHPVAAVGGQSGSSGIWVIDARTLGLVARWDPVFVYEELALTPDGAWLVAAGDPRSNIRARFGGSRAVAFVEPRSGRLAELVGNAVDQSGTGPSLIVAGE